MELETISSLPKSTTDDRLYTMTLTQNESEDAPKVEDKSDASITKIHRRRSRIQFVALCWSLFMAGWNDGSTGPLLPRIQEVYHVRGSMMIAVDRYRLSYDRDRSASRLCHLFL